MTSSEQQHLEEYRAEKDAALLSYDEEKIRQFFRHWHLKEMPDDLGAFWTEVHTLIVENPRLTIRHKEKSHVWLLKFNK